MKIRRWRQKIGTSFWPKMGVKRLLQYYKHRMGRLPGTPQFIARGVATGIAISFTPLIGFHIIIGTVLCWVVRGSVVAMVLATLLAGNPWTLPLILVGIYELGHIMLKTEMTMNGDISAFSFSDLLQEPLQLFWPMMVGSIIPAVVSWILSFYFAKNIVQKYKDIRMSKIHKRAS